jgi:hypothetical protein
MWGISGKSRKPMTGQKGTETRVTKGPHKEKKCGQIAKYRPSDYLFPQYGVYMMILFEWDGGAKGVVS